MAPRSPDSKKGRHGSQGTVRLLPAIESQAGPKRRYACSPGCTGRAASAGQHRAGADERTSTAATTALDMGLPVTRSTRQLTSRNPESPQPVT